MKTISKSLFVFSILLFACGERKENRISHKVTKWENGNIKSEGYFLNDTIMQGTFKGYYPSGKLETEVNYDNNKRNGLFVKYYESGTKKQVAHYKDGIKSGYTEEYYENGKIKWHQTYNLKSKVRFDMDFLETGSVKRIVGTPVVDSIFNKKSYTVGDTLKITLIVATPSRSKPQLHFYEDFATKQGAHELAVDTVEGTAKFEKVLDKKGTMKWGGRYEIKLANGEGLYDDFKGTTTVK